ncbi:MAG: efflux RND transporter periplasmic adaptor subunit [Candidatus Eremiobacteraeota bacterium]|nr:efflux RND transporter periplasmic adaptor subunit [Candidatus Eremiobacteraeota bacterium]MCW5870551.1 efflux RND transporter periplasmic adaptor subunit [Candidatus Eremiobacteraeota bacterium]
MKTSEIRPLKLANWKVSLLLIFLLGVLVPVGLAPLRADQQRQSKPLPLKVKLATAHLGDQEETLELPATVEAVQETQLFARGNGFVESYYADLGDQVRAGQLLARLQASELPSRLAQSQADVVQARADLHQAQSDVARARAALLQGQAEMVKARADVDQGRADLKQRQHEADFARRSDGRWQKLLEDGAVSIQEADQRRSSLLSSNASVDSARQRIEAASAQVRAAQARVHSLASEVGAARSRVESARARLNARQAEVDQVLAEIDHLNIRAPFDGVITERGLETGQLVEAGARKPLFRLARQDRLRVFVDVPQSSAGEIKAGQIAYIHAGGDRLPGVMARTARALDPVTRTLRSEIHLKSSLALAPGMHVQVELKVKRHPPVLVPTSSLLTRSDATLVATVQSGEIQLKPVTVGIDRGVEVEILSGLQPGQQVVATARDSLADGQKVETK